MTQNQCKKINKQIGLRIKALREEQRIPQSDLAEKANISATYLSQLENGKRDNITLTTLYMICDALGIEIDQLLYFSSKCDDSHIDTTNSDELAEERQSMIHGERILQSFYPEKYCNNKISTLLEFLLYLPLIDEVMLYDALNAIQGHFLGNEVYICKRINVLIKRIANSPAKQFADKQLDLLQQKRELHIVDLMVPSESINSTGYNQYYDHLKNKLRLRQLNCQINNLQKEIIECTKAI